MALESRRISLVEGGKHVEFPALSPKWCEKRQFLQFVLPFPVSAIDLEDWKEMIGYYNSDLHWLLSLPHHKFWSQVVYDKSVLPFLVSFLQESPRFFSSEQEILKQHSVWDLFTETYNSVFRCFLRLSTHKETKASHITPSAFGELIYEHFIFDIPKLMDLCSLYGPTNPALVIKMVNNIFANQPKYNDDLDVGISGIIQVFQLLLNRLGLEDSQASSMANNGLLSFDEFEDIITYMMDVTATISCFVEYYPPACAAFVNRDIPSKITDLYEKSVPYLCRTLEFLEDATPAQKRRLSDDLNSARRFLLQAYNLMLHSVSIKPLLNENWKKGKQSEKEECVERWLEMTTCILSEHHFAVDYNILFPLQEDIDVITQLKLITDKTRIDYIRNGLKVCIAEFGLESIQPPIPVARFIDDIDMDQTLILQVKEFLPDLQDDFISACLKHYDYSSESVINSILENNLAPHLIEMQTGAQLVAAEPVPETVAVKPKDISKKSRTRTVHFEEVRQVLDDKVPNLKSVILDRVMSEQVASEYDDEYDDTYDSHDIGCDEADADESGRAFVVPRVLRPREERDDEFQEEDDEDDGDANKPKDQFVPNPAELREQAEQRRFSKMHRGGYRPPAPPRDVVGGPRGQGQDKDTVIARRHKTENKTRGANHNRRFQADRKRREF